MINTESVLQHLKDKELHQERLKAARAIIKTNENIIGLYEKKSRTRLQGQSISAPFFNDALHNALAATLGGDRIPLYTKGDKAPPLVMGLSASKQVTAEVENEETSKSIAFHIQSVSHLAPFLNGITGVICPTENYRQAVLVMNTPKPDLAMEFLDKAVGAYVITLPSLRGIFGLDYADQDQHLTDLSGILFVKLYRADEDSELKSKLQIPDELINCVPGSEKKDAKDYVEQNFLSYLNQADPKQGLVMEACMVSPGFLMPTTEPVSVAEILKPKSKQNEQVKTFETYHKFCLNIIMQAASQGTAYQSATVIKGGTDTSDSAPAKRSGKRKSSKSNKTTSLPAISTYT